MHATGTGSLIAKVISFTGLLLAMGLNRTVNADLIFDNFAVAPFSTGTVSSGVRSEISVSDPAIAAIPGSDRARGVIAAAVGRSGGPGLNYATPSGSITGIGGFATFVSSATWDSGGVNSAGSRSAYAEVRHSIAYKAIDQMDGMDFSGFSEIRFAGAGSWSRSISGGVISKAEFFFSLSSSAGTRSWQFMLNSVPGNSIGNIAFSLSNNYSAAGSFDPNGVIRLEFGFWTIGKAGTQEGTSNGSGQYSLNYQLSSITLVPSPASILLLLTTPHVRGRRRIR